jgi:hypothetical protein
MAIANPRVKQVHVVVTTKVARGFTQVDFEVFSNLEKAQLYQAAQERKGFCTSYRRRVVK